MNIIKAMVMSMVMYASETWTLKKLDRDRLLAFEMKCYRRVLRIRWEQKVTNEEVRSRVQSGENRMRQITEKKLNLCVNICRMKDNRLEKEVMFGMMERETRGEEDRAENCWTTSSNSAEKKSTH